MTKAELKRLIRMNFDPILTPQGFSCDGSRHFTYSRSASAEITHIISIGLMQQNTRYQIAVFGTSSVIEDGFNLRFPDSLHIVNAPKCHLSPEDGISDYQKLYFCGNCDAFMTSFKRDAAPALINIAIPYLDKIQTMEDLIPTIQPGGMMGAALLHVGRIAEAKRYIESEIKRLSALPLDKLGQVERALAFQRELLAKAVTSSQSN